MFVQRRKDSEGDRESYGEGNVFAMTDRSLKAGRSGALASPPGQSAVKTITMTRPPWQLTCVWAASVCAMTSEVSTGARKVSNMTSARGGRKGGLFKQRQTEGELAFITSL